MTESLTTTNKLFGGSMMSPVVDPYTVYKRLRDEQPAIPVSTMMGVNYMITRYDDVLKDAEKITDMAKRDWKLRWNEAEAYLGLEKKMEARAAFSAINFDESLHVDIRRRAKRAVKQIDADGGAPPI